MRRFIAVIAALALVLSAFPSLAAPQAADIAGHWAEQAIRQLMEKGAVSGLPDGTFRPELTVTRAEFVTMVNKSLGISPVSGPIRFSDVKAGDWFAGQVEAAAARGYVTGNPDGTFSPYRPITREQAAAMLVRAFAFPKLTSAAEQDAALAPFSDAASVSAWAKADMATAVSLGLIGGYTPTTLAPKPAGLTDAGWRAWETARTTEQRQAVLAKYGSAGLITRAQTAAVIVRALVKAEELKAEQPEAGVPAKLELEAKDDTLRVGTKAEITATVLDGNDKPVKDVEVAFEVLRDDKKDPVEEKTVTTKSDGTAFFTYTGPAEKATDTVKATAGDLEKEITIDWYRSTGGGGGGGGGGGTEPTVYAISGAVKDDKGQAVPRAKVELYAAGSLAPTATRTTDLNGEFDFGSYAPGSYKLSVQKQDGDSYLVGYKDFSIANTPISAEITVRKALVLTGTLVDNEGNPLTNTPVVATLNPIFRTVTDSVYGNFILPVATGGGVPEGSYQVKAVSNKLPDTPIVEIPSSAPAEVTIELGTVTAVAEDETPEIRITGATEATEGKDVTLTVYVYAGEGLSAEYRILDPSGKLTGPTKLDTNQEEVITIKDVAAGTYTVYVLVKKTVGSEVAIIATKTRVITVEALEDTTAPMVASTDPLNNATGVPVDKVITVTFSEDVQEGASFGQIALKDAADTTVECNVTLSGKVLTIDPNADLDYSTIYTVTIPAGAVKDLAGNDLEAEYTFSFTTAAATDTDAPTVAATSWADYEGAGTEGDRKAITDPAAVTELRLTFSEPIKFAGTIQEEQQQGAAVQVTAAYVDESDNKVLVLELNNKAGLPYDHAGFVWLEATDVEDLAGNPMEAPYVIYYQTAKQPVQQGVWEATTGIGAHEGKVYEEYALKVGDKVIDLSAGKVKSITVLEPNAAEPKTLEPNTDSTLWFKVEKAAGDYEFTIVDNSDITYTATLNWSGPTEVAATTTGQEGEHAGAYYVEYKFMVDEDTQLDLSSFTKMYQLKPDDSVAELTANTDQTLWFKTTGQIPGTHVFLVKKDGVWYRAEIEWGAVEAAWEATTGIGAHDGKVYEEYQLKVGDKVVDLSTGNVKSIKVLEPGATEPKTLEPNADSTLWFKIQNKGGDYVFTVVDKNDITYTATLKWTAPTEVTATKTGLEGDHDGVHYVEYEFFKADNSRLNLSEFTKMYQIKPDDSVVELTANTDSTLWFKTTGQVEGTHTFLVKQGGTWYVATIEWGAIEASFAGTERIGAHDGKVYEEYQLKAGDKVIDLSADNVQSITVVEPGATDPKTLEPNTDSTLWFNVQSAASDYKFTVVDKNDITYTATLVWAGPTAVTAETTGQEGEHEGNYYVEYEFLKTDGSRLDLSSFDAMYQIKPDGSVYELTANTDATLWFKTTGQMEGTHTFLVKNPKNGQGWYVASISYPLPAVAATWEATTGIGAHDGKVYEEYALKVGTRVIDLSVDNVTSISVLEPGATEPKRLEANTDSTLWFNVEKAAGDYEFTIVDNNGITYTATLSWVGPTTVTAKTTGQEGYNQELQAYYVEYEFLKTDGSRLDLSSFDAMYQIKPLAEGQDVPDVFELTANADQTLWFKTTGQIPGTHVFLVKKDGVWYRAEIEWEVAKPTVTVEAPATLYKGVEAAVTSQSSNPAEGLAYDNVRFNITVAGPADFAAGTARESVFTITKVDGSTDTQGINETFVLVDGKFQGYWGPVVGFPMPAGYTAETSFSVVLANTAPLGTYTVTVELVDLNTNTVLASASDTFTLAEK
ncbi:S-layer homology domain-containing protein [Gelria sp. Kuro-4]|uniref:S-layer homology domain-containing protein n=1 Tax=Gelria sp. Kuro-4 TaxID=2796927 RepID=UPI001C80518B|nr:S-layer homology domain-containing protein [Gelria sp. Kuro-4]